MKREQRIQVFLGRCKRIPHSYTPLRWLTFWLMSREASKKDMLLFWLACLIPQPVAMVWHCHFGLHSQVIQFKSHLTGSARLLSKIALPLLDSWIPSVSNRFIESPIIIKIKTLMLTSATEPGVDTHDASISSFLLFSKWKIEEKITWTPAFFTSIPRALYLLFISAVLCLPVSSMLRSDSQLALFTCNCK